MGDFGSAMGNLFVQQLIQVTVVVSIAMLVDRLLAKYGRSQGCYVLWLLVIVKMLTPPVVASPTSIFSVALAAYEVPFDCRTEVMSGWLPRFQSQITGNTWLVATAVGIWLAGVAGLSVVWLLRLRKLSDRPANSQLLQERCERLVEDLCGRLGYAPVPRVFVTKSNFGPAVYGLFKPSIVIPEQVLQSVRDDDLRPVIAHELIHLQRRDTWVGLLQLLVAVVWWFHPLAWVAIRRLSTCLELMTDDAVVTRAGFDSHGYANSLLSVIEAGLLAAPVTGTVGIFSCQVTEKRIRRLIDRRSRKSNRWGAVVAAVVLAFVILPGRGLVIGSNLLVSDGSAPSVASVAPAHSSATP